MHHHLTCLAPSAKRHVSVTSRPARQAVGRNSDNLTTRRRPFVGRRATRRGGEPHVGRKAEHRTESCTSDGALHVGRKAARWTDSRSSDGSCTSDGKPHIR